MSWINSRQFTISNRNGRHYVFRRNNAGNTEINIPTHIVSKGQAIAWLKAHPNKVANPTRYKAKRSARAAKTPPKERLIPFVNEKGVKFYRRLAPGVPHKWVPPPPPKLKTPPGGWRYPAPKIHPFKRSPQRSIKNEWAMTCDELKASLDSLTPIGKGRQGIVFTATQRGGNKRPFAVKVAPRDLSAKMRGEPQPVDIEYNIQDAVQILSQNVVRLYKNMRCTDFIEPTRINMPNVQNSARYDKSQQGIILMEFATGGSLDSWLKKQPKVDDKIMAHIISDILGAIFKIQKRYPYFRHNDLHMQNVFVAERGFLIGDFGWARLKKSGTNPAVNTANGTKTASFWGVGPNTDERYDQHLFLNELLDWAQKHSPAAHPKAIEFLKMAVPPGYRGSKDVHVSEWRLKYDDPCTGLPSLAQVLSHPFIAGKKRVTSLNLKAAKAQLKPVKVKRISSLNLQKAKAKLKAKNLRKPVRLITSLQLRKAKAALKAVPRPKPKPRITGYSLRAAKARLRKLKSPPKPAKAASPPKKKVKVPSALLKSAKFNKLVEKLWKNAGAASGANFQNAWNGARLKAINTLENRIRRNRPAFTPSPPKPKPRNKLPSPLSPLGPPKPKPKPRPKLPSPLSPLGPPKPKRPNYRLSPSSGRPKISSKNTGRWVYANLHYSMDELKALATSMGVNLKGLRSKANIAKRIFSV
jgi:predicted Ser/Thr protein kinase